MEDLGPMTFQSFVGKRVLVTGHTGFCGSWLSLWLNRIGAEVYGVALLPKTNPSMFDLLSTITPARSNIQDITDPGAVTRICQDVKPEFVFHLAAQPLVRQSYFDTPETYRSNVIGTVEVLEAIRAVDSIMGAVMVTTDKVYENVEWVYPYRETDRLGGKDPYSASKAACEIVIESYRSTIFGPNKKIATARGGNIIGGGDWSIDRLIPDIVRAYNSRETMTLRNPTATRPWQHVLALCHGYLALADNLLRDNDVTGAWNFGPVDHAALTTEAILKEFQKHLPVEYVIENSSALKEASRLALDCSKAQVELDWVPSWSTPQVILKTIEWYRAFYEGEDMAKISEQQISEYESGISR